VRENSSITQLIHAIRALPADEPQKHPGKWYRTQKEHWLGWLGEYHRPGAYGRQVGKKRDAAFAYNHIVEVKMLLWLIEAAGVRAGQISAAKRAASRVNFLGRKSAAVRRQVPWRDVACVL
jgi:hypothetical protein